MRPSADRSTDRLVPVVEAAAMLGITPDAVRSRLRRGTLRKDRGPDGEVLVVLNGDQSPDQSPTDRPTVALLEALQDQIDHLRKELAEAHQANKENRRLLAAALERVPAIEAPQEAAVEPRGSRVEASEGAARHDVPPALKQPSGFRLWWRTVFGG